MPTPSITSISGSMIATACGTGTASASTGTASGPKPEASPLLANPIMKIAGIATT